MQKRGLSDVVTTVLIILLVVVAVVAIGAYVVNLVSTGGRTIEREGICLSSTLTVEGCRQYFATVAGQNNRTVVSVKSVTDASVQSVSELSYFFTYADGKTETFTSTNSLPGVGSGAISQDFANMSKRITSVGVGGKYTLKDGKVQSCPLSSPASCARESTATVSYLTPNAQTLNVAGSIGGDRGSVSSPAVPGSGSTGSGSTGSGTGTAPGGTTPITPPSILGYECVDSDSGNTLTVQGTVTVYNTQTSGGTTTRTGTASTNTDSCSTTSSVTEYSCSAPNSNSVNAVTLPCPTGTTCTAGACVSSLPTGLIAHWTFDNTLSSQVGGVSSLTTGPTLGPVTQYDSTGKKNQAYLGSGAANYYLKLDPATDHFSYNTPVSRSVSVWFKLVNQGSYQGGIILSQTNNFDPFSSTGFVPAIYVDIMTRQLRATLFYHSALGTTPLTSSQTIGDNNWHHVVITITSGGTETLYLDGAQVATRTGVIQSPYTQQGVAPYYYYYLGAGRGSSWPGLLYTNGFAGSIDEFRIYNVALTATDVQTLYAAGA
jgi:hypothetical protein